jgi:hypothetical protein
VVLQRRRQDLSERLARRRDWYANLRANPDFVFHLKRSVRADLPARARPIVSPDEGRTVISGIFEALGRLGDPEA